MSKRLVREKILALYNSGRKPTVKNSGAAYPGLPGAATVCYGIWLQALEHSGIHLRKLHRAMWTKEKIQAEILGMVKRGETLKTQDVLRAYPRLVVAAQHLFNGFGRAVESLGLNYSEYGKIKWTEEEIKHEIKKLAAGNKPLNDRWVSKNQNKLYNAARIRYGSWGNALEAMGIDYGKIRRHRKWSRETVMEKCRKKYERGERRDTAWLKKHDLRLMAAGKWYFGSWENAVVAAGIDYRKVLHYYRRWTKKKIIREIQDCSRKGQAMNHAAMNKKHPGMMYAVKELFGSYGQAVEAAGFDYSEISIHRRKWSREELIKEIASVVLRGGDLRPGYAFKHHGNLYSAARRYFGSWNDAVAEAQRNIPKRRKH